MEQTSQMDLPVTVLAVHATPEKMAEPVLQSPLRTSLTSVPTEALDMWGKSSGTPPRPLVAEP